MALFSKPPAKKLSGLPAGSVRPLAVAGRVSARQVVTATEVKPRVADRRVSAGVPRDVEPSRQQPGFEVATCNFGLCAVLENAALLYASGQAAAAREVLEQGVMSDEEARASGLTWHALLDVLQRSGDRAAFDRVALQYVVQFERSAPAWQDVSPKDASPRATGAPGYSAPQGKITAASATQLLGWSHLKGEAGVAPRVDLARIAGFDDAGARLLADALGGLRRRRTPVALENAQKLRPQLDAAVEKGRDAGHGAWLLLLELLQWQGEQAAFDDRAVEYAVTFELSPPSWEPPALQTGREPAGPAASKTPVEPDPRPDAEHTFAWSGEVTGGSPEALTRLLEFVQSRPAALVDMRAVKRIEFVSAGALMNAINRLDNEGKSVRIVRASPILQALLFLLGVSPARFAGKQA